MELYEMFAIESKECASLRYRIFEHFSVWNSPIVLVSVMRSQNVVAQFPKCLYGG